MKVRVTHEITDDERLGIGAIQTAKLQPATREQIEDYITEVVDTALAPVRGKVSAFYEKLAADLKV
jgi:hypothetical protein